MLEKPELRDEALLARLSAAYGLPAAQLTFLPLGADVNTAVYRVAAGGAVYFLKLRRGLFNELSVALPAFLARHGLTPVIAPLPTLDRQFACRLDAFTLALYPFVDGQDGYQIELSESQWVALGAALKRLHAQRLPPGLRRALSRENYSPRYRQRVQAYLARAQSGRFDDPLAAGLSALLLAQLDSIQQLLAGAERLSRQLGARSLPQVLCHADIHNGNLLIGRDGVLHIVDWDTALLAPQERDLMFVGSGLGQPGQAARDSAWFYQGYGPTEIDPAALAYYRCERIVQDIDAFAEQILATAGPLEDRRQALRYLSSQFEPGGLVEVALRTSQAAA